LINNDSPDNTEEVVNRYAACSPVPFSYHVEKRNGLSFARNLGIAKARLDYVAYLDDDAVACPNWLTSFNTVINDHKALVVGGRVETVYEDGFVPPDWFNYQYVKGFFGINYRNWGKKEHVFRVRQPYYLVGCNCAYARQLFRYFNGFATYLGRDGKTLLAGEETYLNLLLEKHDLPIYYTDEAVVYHFIESNRITQEHIRRKAHWAGVSNAMIHWLFFGPSETRSKAKGNLRELRRLVRSLRSNPGDPQNFSRFCRIRYNFAYLRKVNQLQLKKALGIREYVPQSVSWNPRDWIEELARLPKGIEGDRRLYDLYVGLNDDTGARRAHRKLMHHLGAGCTSASGLTALGPVRVSYQDQYRSLVQRIQQTVAASLPAGARVIVVSKGDDLLVNFTDRHGWHFPQAEGGEYAGCYPADSGKAIAHLEALHARGGDFFLLPATALWWLEHYPGLKAHLEQNYRLAVREDDTCLIFALDGVSTGDLEKSGIGNDSSAGRRV